MTSSSCFVYMTLPDTTEPVVAGRYEMASRRGAAIGRFVYAKSYIARKEAVEIDPVGLNALHNDTFERADEPALFSSPAATQALRTASLGEDQRHARPALIMNWGGVRPHVGAR